MLDPNWARVATWLRTQPPKTIYRAPKGPELAHPLSAGAVSSLGVPRGQRDDFRWVLEDCKGLHVQDFGDHWEAHLDAIAPECDLIDHLREDAPGAYVASTTLIGTVVGFALPIPFGALLGAGLGYLWGRSETR